MRMRTTAVVVFQRLPRSSGEHYYAYTMNGYYADSFPPVPDAWSKSSGEIIDHDWRVGVILDNN